MGWLIMAGITVREAARKKILWTALIAGAGFLALFALALHFQIQDLSLNGTGSFIRYQILSAMLMVALYVVDLLAVVMSILTSVDTIPGEISSGTIHAIATKPIPRWQIVIGKWLGFALMIALFVLLSFGGTIAVAYLMAGVVPENAFIGAVLVLLECLLALTVTLLFGTWFSTITSGVLVIGLYGLAFMGGWLEQMSGFTESARLATVGVVSSLIMPSEAIWRRAEFDMQTPLASALPFSPFANVSIPSRLMIVYATIYLLAALMLSLYHFGERDL
jgi:ABC-type transport system involved in multi-copper enzyme maturation permease subunit